MAQDIIRLKRQTIEDLEQLRTACIKNCDRYINQCKVSKMDTSSWELARRQWQNKTLSELVDFAVYHAKEELEV